MTDSTGSSFHSAIQQIFYESLLARNYNGNWRLNDEQRQCSPGLPKANILMKEINIQKKVNQDHILSPGISITVGEAKAGGNMDPAYIGLKRMSKPQKELGRKNLM